MPLSELWSVLRQLSVQEESPSPGLTAYVSINDQGETGHQLTGDNITTLMESRDEVPDTAGYNDDRLIFLRN